MKAKRAQLSRDELHRLRWLLGGVMTLLAAWTVFYMDVDAWTLMGLTTLAAGATMIWPTIPARVPRLVHTLAFPVIVVFFAGDLWLKTEVLPAMVRLDMLLLLYRSISYRQRRDDLQVIVLGLFLVVVAGVLTVSLVFAGQILIFTACALAFLLTITLTDASQETAAKTSAVAASKVPPTWATHITWSGLFRRLRAAADWRVVSLGGALFVGVVVVSGLLFLAIPRFQLQNNMFLERFISKKSRSGFSETIRFGDVTEIQQDTSVALSVDVSDASQIPATPYWRMIVLDAYENGAFRMSAYARAEMGSSTTNWFLHGKAGYVRRSPNAAVPQWTFYLESGVSRYLPLLGRFESLTFREPQNFRESSELALVALRDEPATMTPYLVHGFELTATLPDPRFAGRLRAREQVLAEAAAAQAGGATPPETPKDTPTANREMGQVRMTTATQESVVLSRIAREIVGGSGPIPAAEFAQRANTWLRSNHEYSLNPRIPEGSGDPLVRWLASREAGHCELFAGSLVLLARRAGFPARVITGFRGGSWNAYSNNFTIRNADAHAWAEIFDRASEAWLRVDPLGISAGVQAEQEARGEAAITARADRSWTARLESLRVFWYRRIVSFDQRSQLETLKAVKEATEITGKRLREWLEGNAAGLKRWLTSPWDARRFVGLAGVVTALALVVWLWLGFGRAWWRSWRGARRHGPADDPVRREAGRWLAQLARVEEPGEPAVVRELQRLRFGARATWTKPDEVFRRARHALRAARKAAATRS